MPLKAWATQGKRHENASYTADSSWHAPHGLLHLCQVQGLTTTQLFELLLRRPRSLNGS